MTNRNPATARTPQPVDCVGYRLRRAARLAAKTYDRALRPSGLRNTQFTLLATLDQFGEIGIGDLSGELAIDGTTLTRNLEVLVRRGLVENLEADDGRVRRVRLAAAGKRKFDEAVPLWRVAQQQVVAALEPEPWPGMQAQLRRIEDACEKSG